MRCDSYLSPLRRIKFAINESQPACHKCHNLFLYLQKATKKHKGCRQPISPRNPRKRLQSETPDLKLPSHIRHLSCDVRAVQRCPKMATKEPTSHIIYDYVEAPSEKVGVHYGKLIFYVFEISKKEPFLKKKKIPWNLKTQKCKKKKKTKVQIMNCRVSPFSPFHL